MVAIWYMSDDFEDQRLENHLDPPKYLNQPELHRLTGVEYYYIDPSNYEENAKLAEIKALKKISYNDTMVCSKDCLENYDQKLKIFFTEHLHTDEEIRYVLNGSGYFDVRDSNDQWIRIKVERGDLLILPAGIYHRFTLDTQDHIEAVRYFAGVPVWTPHNRPADEMDCRKEYLDNLKEL